MTVEIFSPYILIGRALSLESQNIIFNLDGNTFFTDAGQLRRYAAEQARGELVLWLTFDGFFWYPRTLLGIEPHLFAFYDQPELMHRMNADLLAHQHRVLEAVLAGAPRRGEGE